MDCDYLITPFCFYKAWNTYLKAGFGYVWIQYLIDFGENKIQGSQACRILLGSMVGIYWIYALFGGHYCLGRKGCSQNTPQKRKKTMDCDYLITPFCFYKAWNTYLKTGFGYVWIQYLIDFVEISDDFTNTDADLEPFSFISGTFWMLAWNLLDFISGTSWFYFCKPLSWMTDDTDDFLFAQHVGLNSPDFIFAFWGSVAWVPLISFYFSGVQPHLGAPQGDILYYIILYYVILYCIILYYRGWNKCCYMWKSGEVAWPSEAMTLLLGQAFLVGGDERKRFLVACLPHSCTTTSSIEQLLQHTLSEWPEESLRLFEPCI